MLRFADSVISDSIFAESDRFSISSEQYIKWVQRSLNRLYGLNIQTNGEITSDYRAGLRRFNSEYLGREDYSDIDKKTQDQLIITNENDEQYVQWVVKALNKAGSGSLPITPTFTNSIVRAIKKFQKEGNLKRDGYVGAKTELALIKATGRLPPGVFSKKVPPKPRRGANKPPTPLTAKEITLLTWVLTGQRPAKVSGGRLATEFARFVELRKLTKSKSMVDMALHTAKLFKKLYFGYFMEEPEGQFGAITGIAYAIMDAATMSSRSRKLKPGTTRTQRNYSAGFNKAYRETRTNIHKMLWDSNIKRILRRLATGSPRSSTLGHVYRAVHEVAISEMGGTSLIYFSARRDCRFNYPRFKTSCTVGR